MVLSDLIKPLIYFDSALRQKGLDPHETEVILMPKRNHAYGARIEIKTSSDGKDVAELIIVSE